MDEVIRVRGRSRVEVVAVVEAVVEVAVVVGCIISKWIN